MNLTAELVKQWAAFEIRYPEASLEEFCRYYLVQQEKEKDEQFLGGIVPPEHDQKLAKLMDRIMKLYMVYAAPALKVVGIKTFDEFLYINTIGHQGSPRKTDVINFNFDELSSGLLIIDRLINKGLVQQFADGEDKRARRLTLTDKGKSILKACYVQLDSLNKRFFNQMPTEDMQLCIQLLSPLEARFVNQWKQHKGVVNS
jgi:predicted transcriptional regulator